MTRLTNDNCTVQKGSGAVIYHKSPELNELIKLKSEIRSLHTKLDMILEILQGGGKDVQ